MLSTGGGGGCRSINWDFIIANNHSKLLCIDIYAEANRPFLHTLFRVHITHAENYKHVQAHTHAHARASANRALPREGRREVGEKQRDFGDRILAIIYASRAYGFRFYGAYECLSAKINGQFVRAHCRR